MHNDGLDVPQPDWQDVAHKAITVAVSSIPIFGQTFAGAAQLVDFTVAPSLERRKEQWMQLVADTLRKLEARTLASSFEELQNNEAFITLLVTASGTALRTHLEEKRRLLANALLNYIALAIPYDRAATFMQLLDTFTLSHLHLLILINGNQEAIRRVNSINSLYDWMGQQGLLDKFEEQLEISAFKALVQNLEQAGVVLATSNFFTLEGEIIQGHLIMASEEFFASPGKQAADYPAYFKISRFGTDFLQFIETK